MTSQQHWGLWTHSSVCSTVLSTAAAVPSDLRPHSRQEGNRKKKEKEIGHALANPSFGEAWESQIFKHSTSPARKRIGVQLVSEKEEETWGGELAILLQR